jgi:hypothetical protein
VAFIGIRNPEVRTVVRLKLAAINLAPVERKELVVEPKNSSVAVGVCDENAAQLFMLVVRS